MRISIIILCIFFSQDLLAGFADLLVFKVKIDDTIYYSPIECWGKLDNINEVIVEEGKQYSYSDYYKKFAKYSIWKSIYSEYSEIRFPGNVKNELDSMDHVHDYLTNEVFTYSESLNEELVVLGIMGFSRCTFSINPEIKLDQIEKIKKQIKV